ncbi:sensor histidine kinase [Actinomadura violacea]|uniref:histidine kinase n=1 Tax=Actinomadura violacea TaxID=2819934 RepID=A0ABS3RMS5_9ACTN|nr:ATP-binding protein [Actinomadura violacea]MBO2458047.1 PAS domain-containing protein [Actinomadura violacea]
MKRAPGTGGLAVAALDSSGRVVGWDAAMEALTGVPADDAIGRRIPELFTLTGEDGTALSLTAEVSGTALLVTREGRAVPVEVSCGGIGQGTTGAALIAVLAERSAARRPNRLRELLFACMAHELHGPLTVIHGHAQLLEASVTDPAAADSLGAIRDAVQMMRQVIEDVDLLIGDRPTTGPRIALEEIDARSLLRGTIRDLPSLAARTVVEEGSRTVLRGDRLRLRQCLLIVLDNAGKYAPEGTITLTLSKDGGWGVIAITDEGPGIPEEEQGSVLRPYYRSAATQDRPGTGLGLHIANVLMASMGGRIDLTSAPSGGLRAELRLPLTVARHTARSHGTTGGTAAKPGRPVRGTVPAGSACPGNR